MSSQTEATNGEQSVLEQVTTTGTQPGSYRQIHTTIRGQVSEDSSPQTIRDHVLKTLYQHVPGLGVADIHDLRVSLTVDVEPDAPVDAQITTVLQAAVATLAEWDHL